MENSIKLLDFETIDQFIQIHDYEGVSMMSRDANQKAAAAQATSIFQNNYPEFLVRRDAYIPLYMTRLTVLLS
jgi:phosphatidylinositol transfer protein SFH5